jgi:hypothetical protein
VSDFSERSDFSEARGELGVVSIEGRGPGVLVKKELFVSGLEILRELGRKA